MTRPPARGPRAHTDFVCSKVDAIDQRGPKFVNRTSSIPVALVLALVALAVPTASLAQPRPDGDGPGRDPKTTDFRGSIQVIHGPSGSSGKGPGIEIFPDASRVYMNVRNTDMVPIERARRGGPWACNGNTPCTAEGESQSEEKGKAGMLQSIKVQGPTLPLPVTIWGDDQLYFNPSLLDFKDYKWIAAYPPVVDDKTNPTTPSEDGAPPPGEARTPDNVKKQPDKPQSSLPGQVDLLLAFKWPEESEFADFRYIAVVDPCGNATVLPYQRSFTIPARLNQTGGCDTPDGHALRVFPDGGYVRVTAFNLDAPAVDDVMSVTYRVLIPALDNSGAAEPAKLLLPDLEANSLTADCSPRKQDSSKPGVPPGKDMPVPPGAVPPGIAVPPGAKPPAPGAPGAPAAPPPPPPPPASTAMPLNNGTVVISPEALKLGNCRINLKMPKAARLVAPLAFHVSLVRTDADADPGGDLQAEWLVNHTSLEYNIPHLVDGHGEARLKLVVSSDPLSASGGVILLADAPRVAGIRGAGQDVQSAVRRPLGSLTIHSVPLCGSYNFETVESTGSCLRGYLTIPAMLGVFQITRAPWIEKPLITRNVLGAVGVAFAIDSYDPVERRAFPVAGQIGAFVEDLDDDHTGLMAYVGVAPTLPVLGEGGSTTTLGFLGGIGMAYIINSGGPDEGLKPTAFLSFVVQVGQANPAASSKANFGQFSETTGVEFHAESK